MINLRVEMNQHNGLLKNQYIILSNATLEDPYVYIIDFFFAKKKKKMQTLLEKHDDFDIEISLIYNILFLIILLICIFQNNLKKQIKITLNN